MKRCGKIVAVIGCAAAAAAFAGAGLVYSLGPAPDDGPGFVRLTVMDARGAVDSVTVRLQ
jgi:hypothetical protein